MSSNVTVLLSLLRKSKYFKQRFVSLAMTFLKDRFVPLTKPFSFADKFANVIIDKIQLQRFLGSLNYIVNFIGT